MPPPSDILAAVVTLRRGTGFLAAGLWPDAGAAVWHGHDRVIANGLREVDRFLSIVIDAVALRLPDPFDRQALRRLDNTARKLSTLRVALGLASPDDGALRAIGRTRDCLFHTGGIVRAGGARSAPTSGWADPDRPSPASPRLPVGSRIAVTAADLRRIGDFYDRLADELLAAAGSIDYRDRSFYMEQAHVACDGI